MRIRPLVNSNRNLQVAVVHGHWSPQICGVTLSVSIYLSKSFWGLAFATAPLSPLREHLVFSLFYNFSLIFFLITVFTIISFLSLFSLLFLSYHCFHYYFFLITVHLYYEKYKLLKLSWAIFCHFK